MSKGHPELILPMKAGGEKRAVQESVFESGTDILEEDMGGRCPSVPYYIVLYIVVLYICCRARRP